MYNQYTVKLPYNEVVKFRKKIRYTESSAECLLGKTIMH